MQHTFMVTSGNVQTSHMSEHLSHCAYIYTSAHLARRILAIALQWECTIVYRSADYLLLIQTLSFPCWLSALSFLLALGLVLALVDSLSKPLLAAMLHPHHAPVPPGHCLTLCSR